MTCVTARQVIHRALDDDLSGRELEGLHAHLATCDACRATFAEMQSMKAALHHRLASAPLPPALWSKVASGMARAEPRIAASRISGRAAAGIITLAVLTVGLTFARNRATDNIMVIDEARVLAAWSAHAQRQHCEWHSVSNLSTASELLSKQVGYRVPAFDFRSDHLQLTATMVCRCLNSKTPVFVWQREGGQLLYLYVLPSQEYVFACGEARSCHSPQEATVRGLGVAGLLADQYLVCAMSDLPRPEFDSFVQRMPELVNGVRP